jgi:ssDNA-binding Zn-finger/Zn-ribbon topoisomerase 1
MEKNIDLIEKILEEKGYELRGISSSGKDVRKIGEPSDKAEYDPKNLLEIFREDDFAVKIFHLILYLSQKNDGFVDLEYLRRYTQARIDDNHLQKVSRSCPLIAKNCPNCGNADIKQISKNGEKIYRCSNNGCPEVKESELKEADFWEGVGSSDIYKRVEKLKQSGFVVEAYQKQCHKCDTLEVGDEDISPSCDNCGSLCDLLKNYSPRNLSVSNLEGVWLEWLCFELLNSRELEACCLPREVGRKDDFHTETDGIFVKDGKLTVIDAKAKNIRGKLSKDEIPNSIMEWQNFADKIIVVTTSTVSKTGENTFKDNVENAEVEFVEGSRLLDLPQIMA